MEYLVRHPSFTSTNQAISNPKLSLKNMLFWTNALCRVLYESSKQYLKYVILFLLSNSDFQLIFSTNLPCIYEFINPHTILQVERWQCWLTTCLSVALSCSLLTLVITEHLNSFTCLSFSWISYYSGLA